MSHESHEFCQFEKAGRRLLSERVVIPEGISNVAVSTVQLADWGYVAGISLTSTTGTVLRLGYGDFDAESSVELPNKLGGFNVAVGVDGIHGLQCVDTKLGPASKWLGCTHDVPKTERLAVGASITELELGFDVCAPFEVLLQGQLLSANFEAGIQNGQHCYCCWPTSPTTDALF